MTWDILVKIGHIVGTVLGVGGATMAEVFYTKLARGGKMDETAGMLMKLTYTMLRLGMLLLVLSGFGDLLMLRFEGHTQYILGPRVLAKLVITAIILLNAILLQVRKMPMWLGAGISFTSWYAALIIGSWRGLPAGFWGIMFWYAVAAAVVTFVLHLIHKREGAKQ